MESMGRFEGLTRDELYREIDRFEALANGYLITASDADDGAKRCFETARLLGVLVRAKAHGGYHPVGPIKQEPIYQRFEKPEPTFDPTWAARLVDSVIDWGKNLWKSEEGK